MENLTMDFTTATSIIGALAFIVSIIIQLIKDLPGIKKIPTKALVILVSIVLCISMVIVYVAVMKAKLVWYYMMFAVLISFIVAYIAMYGWDTFNELKDRFVK